MRTALKMFTIILISISFTSMLVKAQDVKWDFENGDDGGFRLWSVYPATPAPDDPTTAGDESITGVGGDNGLPFSGVAWSIGQPDQYTGQKPAFEEGDHITNGVLDYNVNNDPFGYFVNYTFENERGQFSYLNTYNLNMWGDHLNAESNDQIATSPPVELSENAMLIVYSAGAGGGPTDTPQPEADRKDGYIGGSIGVAVLSISGTDTTFLNSMNTIHHKEYGADTLDLSDYAYQTIVVEAVDAFEGSWGWIAIDEIDIIGGTTVAVNRNSSTMPSQFDLSQNYPNPFNPTTNINFDIPKSGNYSLKVYNLLGEEVATLFNSSKSAGSYSVNFDASNLASGMYIYRLTGDNVNLSRKMLLMK